MEITLEIVLVLSVLAISGLGIVGCIAPALPGPPISYVAILVYHFAKGGEVFSLAFLFVALFFVIAAAAMDYFLPIYTTKKFGGTKQGVWGGIIGLAVGLFIPPWGILVGPLVGAVIGDLVAGKQFESALKAGIGSFVGFILATSAKLAVSITLTVFLILAIIRVHVF